MRFCSGGFYGREWVGVITVQHGWLGLQETICRLYHPLDFWQAGVTSPRGQYIAPAVTLTGRCDQRAVNLNIPYLQRIVLLMLRTFENNLSQKYVHVLVYMNPSVLLNNTNRMGNRSYCFLWCYAEMSTTMVSKLTRSVKGGPSLCCARLLSLGFVE